jgi:RimJ/RimL family protein N-acetyltransferase
LELRIDTPRLSLVPVTVELLRADSEREHFADRLGAEVPANWPPELLADALPGILERMEDGAGTVGWYWLLPSERGGRPTLVGHGGLGRDPAVADSVELTYSVLPQFHRRGYATEAVGAIVRWAFAHQALQAIVAHTCADHRASIRVLEKNGFCYAGEGDEPGTARFVLTR